MLFRSLRTACVRVSVCECVCVRLCSVLLLCVFSLQPPLSGSSELRLCCPAPALKYLTPLPLFPSLLPPSLPPFLSSAGSTRAVRCTRRPPSLLFLLPLFCQSITLACSLQPPLCFSPCFLFPLKLTLFPFAVSLPPSFSLFFRRVLLFFFLFLSLPVSVLIDRKSVV